MRNLKRIWQSIINMSLRTLNHSNFNTSKLTVCINEVQQNDTSKSRYGIILAKNNHAYIQVALSKQIGS